MFAIDKELEELFIDKIKTVLIQGRQAKKPLQLLMKPIDFV